MVSQWLFFFFFFLNKRILFQHYKTTKQVASIIIKDNTGKANSNIKKSQKQYQTMNHFGRECTEPLISFPGLKNGILNPPRNSLAWICDGRFESLSSTIITSFLNLSKTWTKEPFIQPYYPICLIHYSARAVLTSNF